MGTAEYVSTCAKYIRVTIAKMQKTSSFVTMIRHDKFAMTFSDRQRIRDIPATGFRFQLGGTERSDDE